MPFACVMQNSVSGIISYEALSQLSLKLERMLMSEAVERINLNGFASFRVEVQACESELSMSKTLLKMVLNCSGP